MTSRQFVRRPDYAVDFPLREKAAESKSAVAGCAEITASIHWTIG